MERCVLQFFQDDATKTTVEIRAIEREMKRLVNYISYTPYLCSIPGIGKLSAAIVLGELQTPHTFTHYKQVVRYAGLDPVLSQDADATETHISKAGRPVLRKQLYRITQSVIRHSAYFKKLYRQKVDDQKKCTKEARCMLAIKLIKVMMTVLREQRDFLDEYNVNMSEQLCVSSVPQFSTYYGQ